MQRVERQTLGISTPQVYRQESHMDATGAVPHFFQPGYQEHGGRGGRAQLGALHVIKFCVLYHHLCFYLYSDLCFHQRCMSSCPLFLYHHLYFNVCFDVQFYLHL